MDTYQEHEDNSYKIDAVSVYNGAGGCPSKTFIALKHVHIMNAGAISGFHLPGITQ